MGKRPKVEANLIARRAAVASPSETSIELIFLVQTDKTLPVSSLITAAATEQFYL